MGVYDVERLVAFLLQKVDNIMSWAARQMARIVEAAFLTGILHRFLHLNPVILH